MNIFVLHTNPDTAARQQCDKHVVKMTLESAQLMATALVLNNLPSPYKPTHRNHPCAVWARANRNNFSWLLQHHLAMLDEYTKRFNKVHACAEHQHYWQAALNHLPDTPQTAFAQAMPVDLKIPGDAVTAYRNFYLRDKAYFARWTLTPVPDWWQPKEIQ